MSAWSPSISSPRRAQSTRKKHPIAFLCVLRGSAVRRSTTSVSAATCVGADLRVPPGLRPFLHHGGHRGHGEDIQSLSSVVSVSPWCDCRLHRCWQLGCRGATCVSAWSPSISSPRRAQSTREKTSNRFPLCSPWLRGSTIDHVCIGGDVCRGGPACPPGLRPFLHHGGHRGHGEDIQSLSSVFSVSPWFALPAPRCFTP